MVGLKQIYVNLQPKSIQRFLSELLVYKVSHSENRMCLNPEAQYLALKFNMGEFLLTYYLFRMSLKY